MDGIAGDPPGVLGCQEGAADVVGFRNALERLRSACGLLPSPQRVPPPGNSNVVNCPLRISGSVRCDTQMPSSVKASLLDDGVADALVSGGASMLTFRFRQGLGTARVSLRAAPRRESCQQTRLTQDDGKQDERPGNIRGLLSKPSPSRQTDTKV